MKQGLFSFSRKDVGGKEHIVLSDVRSARSSRETNRVDVVGQPETTEEVSEKDAYVDLYTILVWWKGLEKPDSYLMDEEQSLEFIKLLSIFLTSDASVPGGVR